MNSYNKVKKIRRVQEYDKKDKFNVQESQLNNLIDVQLEFENYMNQIDFYRNIFREEKAKMLFDLAHQMEHYLKELSKAFANLKKADPSYCNLKDTQKIINFLDKERFNEDFSFLYHESLGLIREDFLSHTQKSMDNEDSCRIREILLRAKNNESYSISK